MNKTEIFYHGTCHLFDKFSLSFLGSGEGKSKFGQGIYITSSYKTAALYASKAAKANGKESYYVYTVEVPKLTDDNHVFSCKAVNASVVERVEKESNQLSYKPICFGSHLLSHAVSSIVSSAVLVLTVVFGMRTGVSPRRIATKNYLVILDN